MSRRLKVSVEEKMRCIKSYMSGKGNLETIAGRAGVDEKSLRNWIKRYKAGGVEALYPAKQNQVYNSELKQKAVEEYLSGKGGLMEIAIKYKLRSERQLQNWIKVYNSHGDFNSVRQSGGGNCMKQGRETTQEERMQIARECIAGGKNYGEMALKYKVSYQRVRNWTLRYEELREAGLEDRRGKRKRDQTPRTELEKAQIEIEQLKRKLYIAEMENGLLKKLDEIVRRDALDK